MSENRYGAVEYGFIAAFVMVIVACYIAVVVTFDKGTNLDNVILIVDPVSNITMVYKIFAFDPQSYTYKGTAVVSGVPEGAKYTAEIDWVPKPLAYSVFDTSYYSIDQSIDEDTPDGNLLLYPFETYENTMYFAVYDETAKAYIPFTLTVIIEFYGFTIENLLCLCGENATIDNITFAVDGPWEEICGHCDKGVFIEFNAVRRRSTIAFSLIITIVSWFLVIMLTSLTIDTVVRKREVVPPLLGFCAACMFALPTVRNAQPNIPPAGVWIDFMGYFFQISLVGLDLVTLTALFLVRWNPPKKA